MTPINFHKKEKPLTSLVSMGGGAAGMAHAGGVDKTYVEDLFHTQVFKTTTINADYKVTNSIDNSGEGGLVWYKDRLGTS